MTPLIVLGLGFRAVAHLVGLGFSRLRLQSKPQRVMAECVACLAESKK